MAEITLQPAATPKRKRDDLMTELRLPGSPTPCHLAKTIFSFQPPNFQPPVRSDGPTEDGSSSPRSRVAQKFRDLAIEESGERPRSTAGGETESGGGVTLDWSGREILVAPDLTRFNFNAGAATQPDIQLDADDEDVPAARKRPKTLQLDVSNPESVANPLPVDDPMNHGLPATLHPNITSALEVSKSGTLQQSYLSINRLADSKSRSRKRTGTPPPSLKRKGNAQSQSQSARRDEEEELVIVDPVRAALTWREDEITVYDPDDKDDDGTGINGIGFKPTPAVAYRRAQKRRQQLAEYKKREESEARARRNQRRREQPGGGGGAEMMRQRSLVRVHFAEAPPTTVMTT